MLPNNFLNTKLGGTLLLSALLTAAPVWSDHDSEDPAYAEAAASYSYARVVEGPATVFAADGERNGVETHQPILTGDRLWVPEGSRLEAVLADRSLLRVEGESEITFETVAWSAETADRETSLIVREGHLQMVVPEGVLGDALPRISTPDATVYVHREGTFRIQVGEGWTELVVRDGLAELVTDRGSRLVHPGELGWTEGGYRSRLEIQAAGRLDALERWGERLTDEARLADVPWVDGSLRYAAAPLHTYGAWVDVGGYHAWRPRVEVSWRPYYRGYWRHTPLGYTWVSADPWGWVTHHYGSWDYVAGYGWLWYPGAVYAPARVCWYWGPSYVGWVPSGYYAHYYGHHHAGFSLHFGHYGWVSAGWGPFDHWTFTTTLYFGDRHHGYPDRFRHHDRYDRPWDRYYHSGTELARGRVPFERGVVTTDPGVEQRAAKDVFPTLQRRLDELRRERGRDLPEVDAFVARKPLPADVSRVVLDKPAAASKPGWAVGADPLPTVTDARRRGAGKPAVVGPPRSSAPRPTVIERDPGRVVGKPAVVEPSKPAAPRPRVIEPERGTYDKPAAVEPSKPAAPRPRVIEPERRTYDKPTVIRPSKPSSPSPPGSVRDRGSERKPTVVTPPSSSRSTTIRRDPPSKPAVVAPPSSRSRPAPRVSSPPSSSKPAPRVSSPPSSSKPAPRVSSPPPSSSPKVSSRPKASSSSSKSEAAAKSASKSKSKTKRKDN